MNTQTRIQKLEELFHRALKLGQAERARLIAQISASDPQLAAEVEYLISAHAQESNFVDSPAYEAVASLLLNALDSATPTLDAAG